MGIANYTLKNIFNEIKDQILFSKIERIINISSTSFIFSLFKEGKCFDMILSLDPTLPIILTSNNSKTYSINQNDYATNMLKKYFDHGTITKLEKLPNDRIIIFNIKKWTPSYQLIESKLIFELFPLSPNIIITDSNNKILDAFKRSESLESKHLVYKGLTYTFPKTDDKYFDKNTPLIELKNKVSRLEYNYLASLDNQTYKDTLSKMLNEHKYYLYKKDLTCFHVDNSKEITLNELFDLIKDQKVYENKETKHHEIFKLVEQKKKSLEKKLINLDHDQEKFLNGDKYLEYGNLLFIGSPTYHKGDKNVVIEDINIPLDEKLDLSGNAQRYFKLYKKSKSGIEQVENQKQIAKNELIYFNNISQQLVFAQENEMQEIILDLCEHHYIKEHKVQKQMKLKPKNKKFNPHFIKLKNGTKIGYGLTSYQNEELTFSLANKEDYYFHIKDYHGPHVIIFSNNPSDEEMLIAGEIACYFASISAGEVQYTQRKYIKKVPSQRGLALLNKYNTLVIKKIRPSTIALLKNN